LILHFKLIIFDILFSMEDSSTSPNDYRNPRPSSYTNDILVRAAQKRRSSLENPSLGIDSNSNNNGILQRFGQQEAPMLMTVFLQ